VLETPKGATVLAKSDRDPHHLLRYGKNAMSVQFHPEFNADVMRAYIQRKRESMHHEGFDPHRVYRQVAATPIARRLLKSFARHHGLNRGPR
jgi:GMP synthase (glutamine-hydrolysing)